MKYLNSLTGSGAIVNSGHPYKEASYCGLTKPENRIEHPVKISHQILIKKDRLLFSN